MLNNHSFEVDDLQLLIVQCFQVLLLRVIRPTNNPKRLFDLSTDPVAYSDTAYSDSRLE